jgi:hypothetical protein
MIPPQPQRVFLLQLQNDSFLEYKQILTSFVATHNRFFTADLAGYRVTIVQDAVKNSRRRTA